MKLGSLFDGSGTAPLAATMLGWQPVWASEIEPFPVAVTRARFPHMQHLGDITKIDGAQIEPVDVIIGGSPCQDLSVAGKQAGLEAGTRSNMFYEMIRIIKEMREATNGEHPRFVVWENVPGAFSSNKGRDFHAVVQAFCAVAKDSVYIPEPEADRKTGRLTWKNAGTVVGDGWSFAWRVLDAQYWGVPQRRRRIFAVLDLGSECAGEILFERTRLPWDTEPRGAEGEGTPADAVGRADRGGGVGCLNPHDPQTMRIYDVDGIYPTLFANTGGGQNRQAVVYAIDALSSNSMKSKNPHSGFHEENYVKCLDTSDGNPSKNQGGNVIVQETVYALQGNGIDRAETAGCNGRGWNDETMYTLNTIDKPAVVFAQNQRDEVRDLGDVAGALNASPGMKQQTYVAYAADCRNGALNKNVSGTLQAKPNGGQSLNCVNPVVYDARGNGEGTITPTITGDHQNRVTDYTAICIGNGQLNQISMSEKNNALDCMHDKQAVLTNGRPPRKYIVRRLTPNECARLQGFPDWWTDGVEGSDSAKYKMWGNGMALPCVLAVLRGVDRFAKEEPSWKTSASSL